MGRRWIANLCPFLHFDNSRTQTYEHNISIASWNVKSVLDYLDANPDHKFSMDQVTLLEGFKRLFPNYWDTLHQRILEGRIEIVGGSYVQPDFIIPDGESIVRQFLFGTRFIREELGIDVRSGWAIDSSGHCSQMPQILRQCGIDSYYFWRGMPFESPTEFVWKGPDGSWVNTVWLHSGYDSSAWLSENLREAYSNLLRVVESNGEKASSNNLLIPVGGDLAPPLPHLADVVSQWNSTFPDMRMSIVTPREFTEKVKAVQASLPVISGQFSSGRFSSVRSGGLSSRVKLKQMNRRLETLLYLAELYLCQTGNLEKTHELERAWYILLFNQDHNIIRGVCSDESFQLAERRYKQAIEQAEAALAVGIDVLSLEMPSDPIDLSFAVFNPVPWKRSDVVRVEVDLSKIFTPYFELRGPNGKGVPYQILSGSMEEGQCEIIFVASDMPSLGHRVYTVSSTQQAPNFEYSLRTGENWVESDDFVIEFDDFSGAITRLFDKRNQFESLRGPGNFLTMESDVGDLYRYDRSKLTDDDDLTTLRYSGKLMISEAGPIRTVVTVDGAFKDSTRTQRIFLYDGIHRVDLEIDLEFNGRSKRVRTNFPLSVFSERVTTGSQFGVEAKRATPPDPTEWVDPSQGLFSALDWVDCTGPNFGVGLSAFGLHEFEFKDGVLSVTLLRSVEHLSHGRDDDVVESLTAREKGLHSFKLSLLPHSGSWKESKLWQLSTEHRLPLIAHPIQTSGGAMSAEGSALSISGMDLALSCYKVGPAENELTLRLYEVCGNSGTATLEFPFDVDCVDLVDLCEKVVGEIPSSGSVITLPVDAHSIITLRIKKAL